MAKRLFDLVFALLALLFLWPVLLLAAVGVRLSSPGPVLYRAERAGRNGRTFLMHKFRTMRHGRTAPGSAVTGTHDARVFPFGALLRKLKIDELPQLWDVLRGEMSIVGPRPEDPRIVREHYTALGWETLGVAPGLASPGSIYNYTHGDACLAGEDPERAYVERLLPIKLALEGVYVRRASLPYDLRVIGRAAWVIFSMARGRRQFPDPPEMEEARRLLERTETRAPAPLPAR
jgi:lipopolysaccharide/colanic/teichoic acid biosynthesis glycosyltransferase